MGNNCPDGLMELQGSSEVRDEKLKAATKYVYQIRPLLGVLVSGENLVAEALRM